MPWTTFVVKRVVRPRWMAISVGRFAKRPSAAYSTRISVGVRTSKRARPSRIAAAAPGAGAAAESAVAEANAAASTAARRARLAVPPMHRTLPGGGSEARYPTNEADQVTLPVEHLIEPFLSGLLVWLLKRDLSTNCPWALLPEIAPVRCSLVAPDLLTASITNLPFASTVV